MFNIMFHAQMGRFQLESKLELPLFTGFTAILFNQLCSFLQAFRYFCGIVGRFWLSQFFLFKFQRSNVQTGRQKKLGQLRPADDVTKVTKGLQERTQLIEWDHGETCIFNFDSKGRTGIIEKFQKYRHFTYRTLCYRILSEVVHRIVS